MKIKRLWNEHVCQQEIIVELQKFTLHTSLQRHRNFFPWAFIKHLLQTQLVLKSHCQGISMSEWRVPAFGTSTVWLLQCGMKGVPSAFWGLRQCFLREVSPAHCQFPFTKCQGSSPVIVSTTKRPYTFPAPSGPPTGTPPLRTSVTESRLEPSDSVLEDILEASSSMFLCGEEKIEAKRNEVASPLVPTLLIFLFSKPLWRRWDLMSSVWTQLFSSSNSLHIFHVLPFSFLPFSLISRKGAFLISFKFSFHLFPRISLSRGFASSNWTILEQEGWKWKSSPVSPMVLWRKFSNKVRKSLHSGLKEERVFEASGGGLIGCKQDEYDKFFFIVLGSTGLQPMRQHKNVTDLISTFSFFFGSFQQSKHVRRERLWKSPVTDELLDVKTIRDSDTHHWKGWPRGLC